MKTEKETEDLRTEASEASNNPTHPGMTYEDGLRDALAWVLDEIKDWKELF